MANDKYGKYYWCVKTHLSESGEIYANADEALVTETGDLVLRRTGDNEHTTLILAQGEWKACFAASVMDGTPVAVDHWEGELDPT